MQNYRSKIYKYYSSKRAGVLAPDSVDGFKARSPYLLKLISNHFPDDKSVCILEVGCGHGALLYYLNKAGYTNISGIDTSKEQVLAAHRLGINNVSESDIFEYMSGCLNNSLDIVVAFDVIEHLTKEEASTFIDECYRVLKEDGCLITHQPNSDGPFSNSIRYGDFTHETAYSLQSMNQLLLSSGFVSVRCYEDKPIVHGGKSLIRFLLWEYFVRKLYVMVNIIETGWCDKSAIFSKSFLTIARK